MMPDDLRDAIFAWGDAERGSPAMAAWRGIEAAARRAREAAVAAAQREAAGGLAARVVALEGALRELVDRRERAIRELGYGSPDGSDGRYARARAVLEGRAP